MEAISTTPLTQNNIIMLTLNYCIEKKLPIHYELTKEDKIALIEENKNNDYSYFCLLKELFQYPTTVATLLQGYGDIKLFKI